MVWAEIERPSWKELNVPKLKGGYIKAFCLKIVILYVFQFRQKQISISVLQGSLLVLHTQIKQAHTCTRCNAARSPLPLHLFSLFYHTQPNLNISPGQWIFMKRFQYESHQYLTNVQCCFRCNHGQTIHPTQKFYFNEFVANALRDNIGSKKSASGLRKKYEAIFQFFDFVCFYCLP